MASNSYTSSPWRSTNAPRSILDDVLIPGGQRDDRDLIVATERGPAFGFLDGHDGGRVDVDVAGRAVVVVGGVKGEGEHGSVLLDLSLA